MRVFADVHDGALRLTSRRGNDITVAFPELSVLAGAHPDVLLDAELVVLRDGVPSFRALSERIHQRDRRRAQALAANAPATLVAFDVLRLYGVDLTTRSWQDRRQALERLAPSGASWLLSPVYDDRDALLAATIEQGLEGIVAKRRDSTYRYGGRGGEWLKLAHRRVQACVVGGWRLEPNSTGRIGALLIGVWDGEDDGEDGDGDGDGDGEPRRLRFAGRVGSGLGGEAAPMIKEMLAGHTRAASPFDTPVPALDAKGTTWVDPVLVIEVRHLGHTEGGRLRQPVFRGVRSDIAPEAVRDE